MGIQLMLGNRHPNCHVPVFLLVTGVEVKPKAVV